MSSNNPTSTTSKVLRVAILAYILFIVLVTIVSVSDISSSDESLQTPDSNNNDMFMNIILSSNEYLNLHHKYDIISETGKNNIELEPSSDPVYTFTNYNVPLADEVKQMIKDVSDYYNFDELLIYQIIYVETGSTFDIYANNNNTYLGLMQVGPYGKAYISTGDPFDKYLTVDTYDLFNPVHNVIVGIRMLDAWRTECNKRGYYDTYAYLDTYNRGYDFFSSPNYNPYSDKVLAVQLDIIEE